VVAIGLLSLSFFPNNSRKKFMSVSPQLNMAYHTARMLDYCLSIQALFVH